MTPFIHDRWSVMLDMLSLCYVHQVLLCSWHGLVQSFSELMTMNLMSRLPPGVQVARPRGYYRASRPCTLFGPATFLDPEETVWSYHSAVSWRARGSGISCCRKGGNVDHRSALVFVVLEAQLYLSGLLLLLVLVFATSTRGCRFGIFVF